MRRFVVKMHIACDEDNQANSEGQPALSKLKLIPTVEANLSKGYRQKPKDGAQTIQERFLEADVLKALKRWLEPLPDRSLPNATLRERVFNLLMKLPIVAGNYLDKLKSSEIGRAVMFYNKFADEAPANRKLTSVLIERWTRLVLDLDNNYASEYQNAQIHAGGGSARGHGDNMELANAVTALPSVGEVGYRKYSRGAHSPLL